MNQILLIKQCQFSKSRDSPPIVIHKRLKKKKKMIDYIYVFKSKFTDLSLNNI